MSATTRLPQDLDRVSRPAASTRSSSTFGGNGGGLLDEAKTLSGLFIDTGPVVQVKESSASGITTMTRKAPPGMARSSC